MYFVFRLISNSILLVNLRPLKMYTSRKKILKDKDAEPTEFEETVAQVIIAVLFWKFTALLLKSTAMRQHILKIKILYLFSGHI